MRGIDFELFVSRIAALSQKQRHKLLDLLQESTRREQVINAAIGVFPHLTRT